jgi:putative oxidoreductase
MDRIHTMRRTGQRVRAVIDRLNFVPALLARQTVGVVFATSGWGKLHNLDKVTAFFGELGIPAPAFHARFVSTIELVCGALLVVGLLSRAAALPLIGTMIVAIITAKAEEIHGLGDVFGVVEFTYIVLLFWIATAGPGAASLDRLLFRASEPRPSLRTHDFRALLIGLSEITSTPNTTSLENRKTSS